MNPNIDPPFFLLLLFFFLNSNKNIIIPTETTTPSRQIRTVYIWLNFNILVCLIPNLDIDVKKLVWITFMMRIHILLYNSIRIPTMAIKKKDSSKHLTSFHLRSYYSTYDFHNFYHLILLYLRVNSSTVSIFSLRPHTTLHTLPLPIFYFSLPQHTKLSLSLVRELILFQFLLVPRSSKLIQK